MKKSCSLLIYTTFLAFVFPGAASAHHVLQEIHIAGDDGWDYLSVDPVRRHLFATHGTKVDVVNVDTLAIEGELAETPGVHGVAIADDLKRAYVSAGASDLVIVFDLDTLRKTAEIPVGKGPDAILYEPVTHRVFTFNGKGRSVSVIDARQNVVTTTIPIDAKPEFAASDAAGNVFFNLEDRNQIARIASGTTTLRDKWPLEGCESPSGLAIDRAHRRLFAVCENNTMIVIDSASGKRITTLPIGSHADAAAFDVARQQVYASCGDGTLTVVDERSASDFAVVQTLSTRAGARTMTVDPLHHRLFLATADREARKIIPGTFRVLVVEP